MTTKSYRATALRIAAVLIWVTLLAGADWRQFRGTDGTSIAEAALPVKWSKDNNIAWKAPLVGRGPSGPIVVGDRVFITASSGVRQDRLHVLCFDKKSGKKLWHRQFWATGRTLCHPMSSVAAPTPASDGQAIYAFYSSNDLVCLDLDGNLRWMRGLAHDYPAAGNDVGMSSSPAVIGNTVIVQIENQGDSFVAGIDTATGETRWRRSRKAEANWASPLAVAGKKQGDSYVLLQSPSGLTAHEPETGELLWHYEKPCSGIASPVAKDGTVYVAAEGLTALRPTREKRIPEVLWKSNRLRPVGPSAVVDAGHAYSVNGAILVCANTESGGVAWQRRLAGGRYWATPLLAGNHLYVINADGLAQVIAISGERRGEIIEENELGETILGSPAVSGGAIYLRSDQHLWKIGAR